MKIFNAYVAGAAFCLVIMAENDKVTINHEIGIFFGTFSYLDDKTVRNDASSIIKITRIFDSKVDPFPIQIRMLVFNFNET